MASEELSVLPGRHTGESLEEPAKVTLVTETRVEGDRRQRRVASGELSTGVFDAAASDIVTRRALQLATEDGGQVDRVNVDRPRQLGQARRVAEALG